METVVKEGEILEPGLRIYNDDIVVCDNQLYDSLSALIRDIVDNPANYGINGDVFKVEECDSWGDKIEPDLRVWYREYDGVESSMDFNWTLRNIVRLV